MMATAFSEALQQLNHNLAVTNDPQTQAEIYLKAGQLFAQSQDVDQACFFMTQAFIYAIQLGDAAIEIKARDYLQQHNRI